MASIKRKKNTSQGEASTSEEWWTKASNPIQEEFDPRLAHKNKDKCGNSAHIEGFQCPAQNTSAKLAMSLATTQASASRKHSKNNPITSTGNQLCINSKLVPYMNMTAMRKWIAQMIHSVYNWRSSMHKHITRRPTNLHVLITNLA